jgi:hypothetical protein
VSIKHTNDMLRGLGLNVPASDDSCMITNYDYLSGQEVRYSTDEDDRAIMDAAGWDVDSTPVDVFMEAPVGMALVVAQAMERDNDSRDHR